MSICKTQLTEPCKKELLRIISYVSDKELITLLKTEPTFSAGGFRSQKPALLRKRLEQLVFGGPELSRQIRTVLSAHSRSASLFTHLSTETLTSTSSAWATILGDHVFLIAALLDPRQPVRQQAEKWMERTPHFLQTEPDKAITELSETFEDIREILSINPLLQKRVGTSRKRSSTSALKHSRPRTADSKGWMTKTTVPTPS